MDLPVPGRRTRVGDHRTRRPATHLTNRGRPHRAQSRSRSTRTERRRGPRLATRRRPTGSRPRPPPTPTSGKHGTTPTTRTDRTDTSTYYARHQIGEQTRSHRTRCASNPGYFNVVGLGVESEDLQQLSDQFRLLSWTHVTPFSCRLAALVLTGNRQLRRSQQENQGSRQKIYRGSSRYASAQAPMIRPARRAWPRAVSR